MTSGKLRVSGFYGQHNVPNPSELLVKEVVKVVALLFILRVASVISLKSV